MQQHSLKKNIYIYYVHTKRAMLLTKNLSAATKEYKCLGHKNLAI